MKRALLRLEDIATWDHLQWAFWRASRGKRHRPEVQRYEASLSRETSSLQRQILGEELVLSRPRSFEIRDPKLRWIQAPGFRERVLHHALMAWVGPIIERALIDDSFACRLGKGTLAAVTRAQQHCRRFPWYLKMDIRAYFASIDHGKMKQRLRRHIKGNGVLRLCDQIINSHCVAPGKGLPIGSLTSQWFANLYMADLDRLLLEGPSTLGYIRYMDDMVVWGRSAADLRSVREAAFELASERLHLQIKKAWQVQRARRGLSLCGFRIDPFRLRLSKRRKRRYRKSRIAWERAFSLGKIDGIGLQTGFASTLAIVAHADCGVWRQRDLDRHPPIDA